MKRNVEFSKTALCETVLASVVIGVLLSFFGLYFALAISSVFAVPVFLKSPQSIELANSLFDDYWQNRRPKKWHKPLAFLLAIAGFVIGFFLLSRLLIDPPRFLLTLLVLLLFMPLALASGAYHTVISPRPPTGVSYLSNDGIFLASRAIVPMRAYLSWILRTSTKYWYISGSVVIIFAILIALGSEGAGIALFILFIVLLLPFNFGAISFLILGYLGFYLSLGSFIGVMLRAFVIRIYSVSRFFFSGVAFFSENWLKMALSVSWKTPPQIVPLIPFGHELSFEQWVQLRGQGPEGLVRYAFGIAFFFLPSIAYRYLLKSTALFYLPLVWISMTPAKLIDENGRMQWLFRYGQSQWERITFWTSILAIVYPSVALIDPELLAELLGPVYNGPISPVHYFLVIDPSRLNWWYWISLPCAIANVAVAIWTDHLRKNEEAGLRANLSGGGFKSLIALNQARIFLSYVWLFATFLSAIYASWLLDRAPRFFDFMFS